MFRRLSLRARLVLGVIVLAALGLGAADVATYTSLRSFEFDRTDSTLDAAHPGVEQALLHQGFANQGPAPAPFLPGTVVASPMVTYRGPFVLAQPDEAWFNVNMMQKDMNLALELGRQLDVPLPTTATTNELLTAARAMGLEEKDFSILFEVLAAMSGVGGGTASIASPSSR